MIRQIKKGTGVTTGQHEPIETFADRETSNRDMQALRILLGDMSAEGLFSLLGKCKCRCMQLISPL
jgi:hypothetical protein